jgi:predicted  nucleic acid-binding Zn-ribbon protein
MKAEMKERLLEWICLGVLGAVAFMSLALWCSAGEASDKYKTKSEDLQSELVEKKTEASKKTNEINDLSKKLDDEKSNVQKLEKQKSNEIKELEQTIKDKEKKIKKLKAKLK